MSAFRTAAVFALLSTALAGAAEAQKFEQPKIEVQKVPAAKISPAKPINTATFQHNYAGGDMATYWVSPLMRNHDGKISGTPYQVDGKTIIERISFSVVNSSLEPLEVKISCQNAAGAAVAKYSATLSLAPYGAAKWSTDNIAPTRSTDRVTPDVDEVWCGLTAPRPFAAFGNLLAVAR